MYSKSTMYLYHKEKLKNKSIGRLSEKITTLLKPQTTSCDLVIKTCVFSETHYS